MTPLQRVLERQAGGNPIRVSGLAGSSKAYFLAHLLKEGPKRVYVYLTSSPRQAASLQQDLKFFGHDSLFFPPHDALPFSGLSPHLDVSCQRMAVLASLLQLGAGPGSGSAQPYSELSVRPGARPEPPALSRQVTIITTPTALLPQLPPRGLLENPQRIEYGAEVDRDQLLQTLLSWGYQKVPLVSDRGTFAVRGAILDIFSPGGSFPHRIEWQGDLVESIRPFDPETQKSVTEKDEIFLIPAREVLLAPETIQTFQENVRARAEERDIPKAIWGPPLEKVRERIYFSGIETYLPLFYPTPATFWDYLTDPVLILDDPASLERTTDEHLQEVKTIAGGRKFILDIEEVLSRRDASTKTRIEILPLTEPDSIEFRVETHEGIRQEIDRRSPEPLKPLARRIQGWLETGKVVLVAPTETQVSRLRDLLDHYFAKPFPFEIIVGTLSSGFRLVDEAITYLTDEEIFGTRIHRPHLAKGPQDLSALSEMKSGDPLVHKQHGIGLYRGLVHMTIEGASNDFLLIEYQGGDKLYLPVYRMNLVNRFTGADGPPRIDRLGGTAWLQLRKKAEKAIQAMAGDLLNLYAARSSGKGHPFSPPGEMFEAFEASFPFEETPDQERAIQETLADMQGDRPMDRLVLGDVGYGKTEVAMRAAFLASLDGKQAAVLVPTTVLAFQHFQRFQERFRDLPVRTEMVSRFRPPAEQKRILKEVAEGKIDVLIGTHRLFQPDVSFKNLGLLVIDEEHRFGVSHKEKIKRLRKNVDVLTLSATPIPRTLYMSLTGIRPVSVIETPPSDRLAIRTYVMPFQGSVVREAILREIHRGGQVFFVHNEVESIGRMKESLAGLIPEAKAEVAHGQMEESELEEAMIRFYHQEFNLLLCTTIIESGIDIPTANTILINHAEKMGLAQVYQLRGRVGRGGQRAFAYLLVPEDKELTPEAVKRLEVLQKFSDLGSGFRMASYDLEIRGAGNLLGKDQSGHMTSIGYELYTELLEKAIREMKGEKVLEEIDPELHFKMPAYLPESYLPDPPLRLEMYRRLSSLDSEEELEPIIDELRDRFGKPPVEVENLLELSAIKALAKKLRLKQIRYDGRSFSYAFDPSSPLPPEVLVQRIKKDPKGSHLTPDMRYIVKKSIPENLALMETKRSLRELVLQISS